MRKDWKPILGIIVGLGLITTMVFANQLGVDNNSIWGPRRYILFSLGILIFVISLLYREDNFIGHIFHTDTGQIYLSAGILSSFIIIAYVWWVSLGLWTNWPASTNYYDLLATAFSHGQIALEIQPDSALLALENPYEPANRENIPVLWDATFYQGKYYLYWGPAPALLIAIVKLFYSNEIGDNTLTLVFSAGMFIFLTLLILHIWKNYFPNIPRAVIFASIALAGLINPIPFVLIESRIYEAAVVGGQFFFIGGLFFLFAAFNKPSLLRIAIAGMFFTLAVSSRTLLALPIAFVSIIIFVWAFKTQREKMAAVITAFATPLVMGGIAYGWYNFARFGSITEFGYTYQLTGFNINATIKDTFSLAYIPPNLFKTLFNPLELRSNFPFIKPVIWAGPAWFQDYNPKIYYYLAEAITGMLIGSPFLIFAFLRKHKDLFWVSTSLAGSTLLTFFLTQIFFYTTMRYLLDLVPALTILALIGFWSTLDNFKEKPHAKLSFIILGGGLWAYTIVISILLTFSSNPQRFKEFNPELFQQLTNLFR